MLGQAALSMWWNMAPAMREEFEHWHAHEHFPERLALPGFLRGSRWADAGGGEGFFILYELVDHASLTSPDYLARLNAPSDWSRRLMPHHRDMVRSQCRVRLSRGGTIAGHTMTVRLTPAAGAAERLLDHVDRLTRDLHLRAGVIGAHLLQTDTPTVAPTTEQKIRGNADRAADWVLIVSGYEAQALEALAQGALSAHALALAGAQAGATIGTYALRTSMVAAEAR